MVQAQQFRSHNTKLVEAHLFPAIISVMTINIAGSGSQHPPV